MGPQRRTGLIITAGIFPTGGSCQIKARDCRRNIRKVERRRMLISMNLNFLGREIVAIARAIQAALTGQMAILIIVVMMAAVCWLRYRDGQRFAFPAVLRMVPAAAQRRMDEQQGGHQVVANRLHNFAESPEAIVPCIGR